LASDTKPRMIERAVVLLAKKGLQGTSFSEVLEASGAPRGSLYYHFPGGKEELVLVALTATSDRALSLLDEVRGKPAAEVARNSSGCGVRFSPAPTSVPDAPLPPSPRIPIHCWKERLLCFAPGGRDNVGRGY
jgi:AcrR family transcriptional regulator